MNPTELIQEKKIKSPITRDSNVELLRIIAMFFIMCHHFIVNSLYNFQLGGQNGLTIEYGTYSMLEGFFYVGVNCFLLISGYYGIRLRASKIWSMYLQLGFYGVGCYLFEALVYHKAITHTLVTKSVFILSHPCWWFVANFLLLMFLSPWINHGIQRMSKNQYRFALIGFTFVQVYLGWFWQKTCYDVDGYSLLNFVYIYVIGGYIGRFVTKDSFAKYRWKALIMYVLCAVLWGICNILKLYTDIPFGNNHGYNNPIVVGGAVALFMFVLSYSFHNKYINWIAGGAFATYLITDAAYVGYYLYTGYGHAIHSLDLSLWLTIVVTMLLALVILLICSCIDHLRVWLMRPILHIFDNMDRKFEV